MHRELLTLGDYVGVLRRRKLWLIALAVLGTAAAYGYAAHQSRIYQATAQVTVSNVAPPTGLGGAGAAGQQSASSAQRYLSDQATLARSVDVAALALKLANYPQLTPLALLRATSTTPNASADVFSITVRAGQPKVAAALAAAYADAYVQYRRTLNVTTFAPIAASLKKELKGAQATLKAAPKGERTAALKQLQGFQKQSANLEAYIALQDRGTSVVFSPTEANANLAQPKTSLDVAIGAGAGLILGVLLAFVLDALDARTRSTRQISHALRLPIVGRIPTPPRRLRRRNRLVMGEPSSAQADAFRKLAARIAVGDAMPKVILITSAVAQEGKTTTACNLALALAEIKSRVVLVDLDLLHPCVARFFDLDAGPGVTDVLEGTATVDQSRTPVQRPGQATQPDRWLEIVSAGGQVADRTGVVASAELEALLATLADSADVVIVDTPPALAVSHATLLSRHADAVLAIARVEVLTVDLAEEFQEALSAMPAEKIGFVVTGADREGRRYGGGYGYGYGYGYRPQEMPPPLDGAHRGSREGEPAEIRPPHAPPATELP